MPGGVRLATKTGTVVSPVQLSQPKLPGCVPLARLERVSPGFAVCKVSVESVIG